MELQTIPLRDRSITAILDTRDGSYHIPFRPACDAMGLDYSAQLKRVKRHHWATVAIMTTVAEDGKDRELVTLNRKTFTFWLGTLVASRIKDDDARKTVELFQTEAVEVLDRHFSPGQAPAAAPPTIKPTSSTLDLIGMAELLTSSFRKHYELEQFVHERDTYHEQRNRDLETRLAKTQEELIQARSDSARAVRTVTSESGYFTLVTWAEQHGVYLTPPNDSLEGKVVKAMCLDRGIEPGQWKGPRYNVGTYPEHILYLWLDNYRGRGTSLRVASPA